MREVLLVPPWWSDACKSNAVERLGLQLRQREQKRKRK